MKQRMLVRVVAVFLVLFGTFAVAAQEPGAGHEVKAESSAREVAALDGVPTDPLVQPNDAIPFRLDDYPGWYFRGKPILDLDGVIGQIDSGRSIRAASGKITYSFLDNPTTIGVYNNPRYGFSEPYGYEPFSEEQKQAARLSMTLWDDLIPQRIVELNGLGADVLFANTVSGPAQAWAYLPGQGIKLYSDVWIHTPWSNWSNAWLNFNGYGLTTIIHEAGHALGLSHPGAYNFGSGVPLTYLGLAEYAQDSEQFSIMSYWAAEETGAFIVDWRTGFYGNEQAPLVHDILVLQSKYGVDRNTRAGDTVYGYNSNADSPIYDFTQNPFPYLAIHDAGGNDTLDLSGARDGVFIDLRPGSFSSAAGGFPTAAEANVARAAMDVIYPGTLPPRTEAQMNYYRTVFGAQYESLIYGATGVHGVYGSSHWNLGIAYSTIIENAIGGPSRDLLVGNHVANVLVGNGGDDVLNGLQGDDTLTGGPGADTYVFGQGAGGTDTITDFESGIDKIDLSELGVGPAGVTISGNTITGAAFSVDVQGDPFQPGDILY